MVLIKLPVVTEVTLIFTVQDPAVEPDWAGTVPPLKLKVVDPGTAVTEPAQLLRTTAGLAMMSPGWTPTRLSVQDVFVSANTLGLKMVTLRTDVWPARIDIGEKLLLISAGREMLCAYTVCAGVRKPDMSKTTTRKGINDLRILSFVCCMIHDKEQN
jgi:hypothetical protein